MTVSHRIESQQLSGLLSGFVGQDVAFATISGSFRMTRLDLRLTDAPSGGTVVAMVNTVTGGGGTALLSGTVLNATRHISVTGDIAFSGTTTFYLRVTSESGTGMGLSASVEVSLPDGGTVTVFLSSLQNVKDSAGIVGSANDSIIQRHLEGVSAGMQRWMGREIVSTVRTEERHYPTGVGDALVLDDGPIISIEAVRDSGTALATTEYRTERGRILRRVSGEGRVRWTGDSEIEVDYTAGYAAVPSDLVDACTQETVRRWLQTVKGLGPGAHITAMTPDSGNTKTFEAAGFMPQTVQAMRPYRKLS